MSTPTSPTWYPFGERPPFSRLTFLDVMNRSESEINSWQQLIGYLSSQIIDHLRTPAFVAEHLSSRQEGFDAYEAIADRLRVGGTLTTADWISVDDTICTLDMSNVECLDLGGPDEGALVATWPAGPAGLATWLHEAVRYAGLDTTNLEEPIT